MNPYISLGSGIGTPEAVSLAERLAAWHDSMVAHERRLRFGRTDDLCDDECPHVDARTLWTEAVEMFGDRLNELRFLRSRATAPQATTLPPIGGRVDHADGRRRSNRRRRAFSVNSDSSSTSAAEASSKTVEISR